MSIGVHVSLLLLSALGRVLDGPCPQAEGLPGRLAVHFGAVALAQRLGSQRQAVGSRALYLDCHLSEQA